MQILEKTKSPLTEYAESVIDRHTANFSLQKINPLGRYTKLSGKVVKKEQVAHDMVSLTLQTNRHFQIGRADNTILYMSWFKAYIMNVPIVRPRLMRNMSY